MPENAVHHLCISRDSDINMPLLVMHTVSSNFGLLSKPQSIHQSQPTLVSPYLEAVLDGKATPELIQPQAVLIAAIPSLCKADQQEHCDNNASMTGSEHTSLSPSSVSSSLSMPVWTCNGLQSRWISLCCLHADSVTSLTFLLNGPCHTRSTVGSHAFQRSCAKTLNNFLSEVDILGACNFRIETED